MASDVTVVVVSAGEASESLLAALQARGLSVHACGFADAEEEIDTCNPDLVILTGVRGAMELTTLLDDDARKIRPRLAIVARSRELTQLRGLNRQLVVSVLTAELGDRMVSERLDTLARKWAKVREDSPQREPLPTIQSVDAVVATAGLPSADFEDKTVSIPAPSLPREATPPIDLGKTLSVSPKPPATKSSEDAVTAPAPAAPAAPEPPKTSPGFAEAAPLELGASALTSIPASLRTARTSEPNFEALADKALNFIDALDASRIPAVSPVEAPAPAVAPPAETPPIPRVKSPLNASRTPNPPMPEQARPPLPLAARKAAEAPQPLDPASILLADSLLKSIPPSLPGAEVAAKSDIPPSVAHALEDKVTSASEGHRDEKETPVSHVPLTGVTVEKKDARAFPATMALDSPFSSGPYESDVDELAAESDDAPLLASAALSRPSDRPPSVEEIRGPAATTPESPFGTTLPLPKPPAFQPAPQPKAEPHPPKRAPSVAPAPVASSGPRPPERYSLPAPSSGRSQGKSPSKLLLVAGILGAGGAALAYYQSTHSAPTTGPKGASTAAAVSAPTAAKSAKPATTPAPSVPPGTEAAPVVEASAAPVEPTPTAQPSAALPATQQPSAAAPTAEPAAQPSVSAPIVGGDPYKVAEVALPTCESLTSSFVPAEPDAKHEASIYWRSAREYIVKGDLPKANLSMCQAAKLQPETPALEGLAMLYLTRGAPSQALIWVERAEKARPNVRETMTIHADILSFLGRPEEALTMWLGALNIPADDASRRRGIAAEDTTLGRRFLKQGDLPRAERLLRRAAALDPDNAIAASSLAETMKKRGHASGAAFFAAKSLAIFPMNPDCEVILGDLALEAGHREEAKKHYQKALDIRPDFWAATVKLRELEK